MLRKTLRNFASQLLGMLISIGDRFLLTAILLRMWPTDLFADWTTLMAGSGLLSLADLLAVLESASPFVSIRSLNSSEASLVLFSLGEMQAVTTTKSAFTQIYRAYGEYSRGVMIDSVSSLCIVVAALGGAGPRVLALTYILAQVVFAWGILLTDLRRRYPNLRLWPLPPTALELRDAALVWGGAMGRMVGFAIGTQGWVRLSVCLAIWGAVTLLPVASVLTPASQHKRLWNAAFGSGEEKWRRRAMRVRSWSR